MKTCKLGLIGCGGRSRAHIRGMEKLDYVEFVSVADPNEERAKEKATATGATKIYKDHKELLDHAKEDGLDALIICVDPTAHTEDMELRAIEMGLPFLVEKPMTVDLDLAEKIAAKVEEKGLITSVGFQDRYLDLVDMIKEELPKHKQGGLVFGSWVGGVPGPWWWQKKSTCGGQLVEQNIHLLDGLRYLYGEPLSVYATCSRGINQPGVDGISPEYDTDDHSTVVLRFPGNVTATLVSGCYSNWGVRPPCGYQITLNDMVIDYRLRNNITFITANETRDIKRTMEQTDFLDKVFVDAVLSGDGSKIRSPYSDALISLKLGFKCNESMESGQVIYF